MRNVIQIAILLSFLISLNLPAQDTGYARYPFLPEIKESKNDKLCAIINQAYIERFKSDQIGSAFTVNAGTYQGVSKIQNNLDHPDISWVVWEPMDGFTGRGLVLVAKADAFSSNSRFVLHIRNHSWRGDIYTIYLANDANLMDLIGQLNQKDEIEGYPVIYPAGNLRYGGTWTWWLNDIFLFEGRYFYIGEIDTFDRHKGIRHVYQVYPDGATDSVCTLKIIKTLDEIFEEQRLPVYSAMLNTINNIHGRGNKACAGTMNAHARSRGFGNEVNTRLVFRPWTPAGLAYRSYSYKQILSFLEDWALGGIWNLREYHTFENYINSAKHELKQYYIHDFGLPNEKAQSLAEQSVHIALSAYMVIPSSYQEFRPSVMLEHLSDISSGKPFEWSIFNQKPAKIGRNHWSHKPGALNIAARLAIDAPKSLDKALEAFPQEEIVNAFSKTLLMYAVHMNHYDSVESLIRRGVDINATTGKHRKSHLCSTIPQRLNRNALHYAAENASIEIIDLLVKSGADVDAKDSKNNDVDFYFRKNPRFTSAEKEKGLRALIKRYAGNKNLFKPGFDCNKAVTRIEKGICSSKTLSIYDRELGTAYRRMLEMSKTVSFDKTDQAAWLRKRDLTCNAIESDIELAVCLLQITRARTRYFHNRIANYEQ